MQSDLDALEARVRERTQELEKARAVAQLLEAQVRHQEKMAGLGVLAAGFAHDMGNPLASLSTELELLEGETDIARYRESLDVLRRHVGRMSRTLREMVDFARRRREEVTDVSIASAVDDSSRLVLHDPRWKKVRLDVDVPADLPRVRMVEDHLVLVLVNLMINAGDAMPDGGTVAITARPRGRFVDLTVRDTGQGMTADVLARAKAPMFTTKPGGRGTGLGLAVCDNVVRSVGGEMTIASAPGAGTEVTITLPAAEAADG
jgi:signal transduction histidine kinase